MSGPIERAHAAWGAGLPDWVAGLAAQCAAASQSKVAKRLGVSSALVSNVLGAKYPGNIARVEDLYRGAFEAKTVNCPALGTMALDRCRMWRGRSKKLSNNNTLGVTMFRACTRCPRNAPEDAE